MKRAKLAAAVLSGLIVTAGMVVAAAPAQATTVDHASRVVKVDALLVAVAPTISSPTPQAAFDTDSFVMAGTGEPGATIMLDVGGNSEQQTLVAGDGSWSVFVSGAPLGKFTVTLTQTKEGYNTYGLDIDLYNFSLVATGPAEGATLETQTPTFTGYGSPDTLVTVLDANRQSLCTANVSIEGTWSCTSELALPYGSTTVSLAEHGVADRSAAGTTFILAEAESTPLVAPALGAGAVVALLAGAVVVFARRRATAGV